MDGFPWHEWWLWAAAAVALGILEVIAPGFIFLGFALGAGVLAVLLLITPLAPSIPVLLILFGVFSILAWLGLRRFFHPPGGQKKIIRHDIND